MSMVSMDNDITPDEARSIWDQLDAAPDWCARHRVGMLLRSEATGNLYETLALPRLERGLLLIKVCRVGRRDLQMDMRVSSLGPVDGLTALGEQAE